MRTNLKRNGVISAILALAVLLAGQPLFAHHGSNNYDNTRQVSIKGTVTQFVWSNPHCQLYFNVTDDKGNVVRWGAEMQQPRALATSGFTKDIMKPGDTVTVTGSPARSGQPRMFMHQITLSNGKVLRVGVNRDQNGNPIDE